MAPVTVPARVLIVGTGLIGTSVALALRARGVQVWLNDVDAGSAALAEGLGAGTAVEDLRAAKGIADVAVLAMPPDAVGATLALAQGAAVADVYTDVASVKALPVARARELGCELGSYVPGHPLAGRERHGPAAARGDLFLGRTWALCPLPETSAAAVSAVSALAVACGAEIVETDAATHDQWVALVSHAPHVVSAAMAARLAAPDVSADALRLAGGGLRDVTRIAAGDTALWAQILSANAAPVAGILKAIADDLSAAAASLQPPPASPQPPPASLQPPPASLQPPPASLQPSPPAASQPPPASPQPPPASLQPPPASSPQPPPASPQPPPASPQSPPASLQPPPAPAPGDECATHMPITTSMAHPSASGYLDPSASGDRGASASGYLDVLDRGRAGVARIPGKRGDAGRSFAVVQVVMADRPGELARLFGAAGEADVNVEDVRIEHSPGHPTGVAEISVRPDQASVLLSALAAAGWTARR